MVENTKGLSVEKRKAILEEMVNGEALKKDMDRKTALYPKHFEGYLRRAEVTDALKVGSDKEGGYLVPDEMEKKLVKVMENKGLFVSWRMYSKQKIFSEFREYRLMELHIGLKKVAK